MLQTPVTSKDSIATAIVPQVETGQLAGAAALAWRDGKGLETAAIWFAIGAHPMTGRRTPQRAGNR
jgi:hypothetical protein